MHKKRIVIETRTKCYKAEPRLDEYLTEKLQIETERQRIRDAGEAENGEFQSRVRANDAKKVHILDKIIFPSMANLTFFLHWISSHREIQSVYENDLKDLLGVTRNNPNPENYAFMLDTIVHSILNTDGIKDDEKRNKNFRIALIHKIQQILSIHFQRLITEYSPEFWPLMDTDMNRILGYTSLISKDVFQKDHEDSEDPSRTFPLEVISDREYITRF